jgi:hypothetical protein
MPTPRKRRFRAILAVLSLIGASFAVLIGTSNTASADTIQSNGCFSPVTSNWTTFPIPITGAAAPDSIFPGETTTLAGVSITVLVDSALIAAGVGAGVVQEGDNFVYTTVTLRITGSNTVEGEQTATGQIKIVFNVQIDPDTGEVTVTPDPVLATVLLSDTTWTADGNGPIAFAEATEPLPANLASPTPGEQSGAPLRILNRISGVDAEWPTDPPSDPPPGLNANFICWPGEASEEGDALIPGPANAIATVDVEVPATPPTCSDISRSVGLTQSIDIDVVASCTDPNSNIDPSTVEIIDDVQAGTTSVDPVTGVVTYDNTDATPNPDSFTFTVSDTTALTSNIATVTINILANQCDATDDPCSLSQVITVEVIGATMTMDQAGQFVSMADVVLDGEYKVSTGAIQQITVTNARGTAAGWNVTGTVSDFLEGTFAGSDCTTPDRLCIPGGNLDWAPSAEISHTVIPGDVAQVDPGSALADTSQPWLRGLSSAQTLCSAPDNQSGGTFACNALLYLGVPASAGAGTYTATLTLTLV